LHIADGLATIVGFKDGPAPEAIIDLSPAFKGQLKIAQRKFVKESGNSLLIEDKIELSAETSLITWQMLTTANVEIVDGGAVLRQEGRMLRLENLSHPDIMVSVVSLYPAPLKLDRQILNLKRIEIRIPAWTIENGEEIIKVRLSGN
jgi:hypothetical protein